MMGFFPLSFFRCPSAARSAGLAFALCAALLCGAPGSFAAGLPTVHTTVLDADNHPIGGAHVVLTGSSGQTFSGYTNGHGSLALKVPPDTYTITASRPGFTPENLPDMTVAADMDLSVTIDPTPPAPAATPAPPARTVVSQAPKAPAQTPAPANVAASAPPPKVAAAQTAAASPTAAAPASRSAASPAPQASPSPAAKAAAPVAKATASPAPKATVAAALASAAPAPPVAAKTAAVVPAAPQAQVIASAPAPAPVPQGPRSPFLVRDSVLATYDAHHPEHARGAPYYGRYTYVLLGSDASDPRNIALVTALVALHAPGGSSADSPAVANPYDYNIFLLPIVSSSRDFGTSGKDADALLSEYDYKTAAYLRERYCKTDAHTTNTICSSPDAGGPVMLTLAQPLQGLKARDPFPATLAYDFSAVAPAQYPTVVAALGRKLTVPETAQADETLPLGILARYVAPMLISTAAFLAHTVPTLRCVVDFGIAS